MKPTSLRLIVMHVSTRCDQTCAHCSIWKPRDAGAADMSLDQRMAALGEARALGARTVLFTGGEPLLSPHLETLAEESRRLGMAVHIATNGLGLGRATAWVRRFVDEIYVSFEGPEATHDRVRGAGSFEKLRKSLAIFGAVTPRPKLVARSAISGFNARIPDETANAAVSLGFDAISFLPVDTTSEAFGGDPAGRESLRLSTGDIAALRAAIDRLAASGRLGSYVVEDAEKLRSFATLLEGPVGSVGGPPCNAPEWSSVIEADGGIRPCFFQPRVAAAGASPGSLREVRGSAAYARAIQDLGPGNPICAACVCPKYEARGFDAWRHRLGRAVERVTGTGSYRKVRAA